MGQVQRTSSDIDNVPAGHGAHLSVQGSAGWDGRHGPIVWLSHGFGYNGELLYFGEIFRAFCAIRPETLICVDRATPFRNPYQLPLRPLLRFWRKRMTRSIGGVAYEADIMVPSPGIVRRLRSLRPRAIIVIEFTPTALLGIVTALTMSRTVRVLLVESDPSMRGGSTHPLVRAVKRWAVARMDAIQTNTVAGAHYLTKVLGADPSKVTVAPYLTSRPPGPPVEIGRPAARLRLLFANSLSERKGPDHFIEALGLCDGTVRAQLDATLVGDGPLRDRLEARVDALDLGGTVLFAGPCRYDELHGYYSSADVLVIPSLADYRSLSSFEGLAYGLALLASRFDGASQETVVDGENGILVDPRDHHAFAAGLAQLVADPDRVLRFRRASLSRYERFSVEAVARNLSDTLARAESAAANR